MSTLHFSLSRFESDFCVIKYYCCTRVLEGADLAALGLYMREHVACRRGVACRVTEQRNIRHAERQGDLERSPRAECEVLGG